ncbi:EFR1 family ferrodoxin [Fusibacter paucivorans]|uniref:EFR1 family ferrodoxin n=1 Tax=Fusibacter paucivorans TaxID=76009 RepID=A0ABS5PPE0_9FIRM|nr:EFR1 family ferrodoxin [Fusibacter paucivorans]MBS7527039.1 EFR1 family ferrodoxin [Fusibacter paucivorans]
MLAKAPISIYYFSGTGNTLLMANAIKQAFEQRDYRVTLKDMMRSKAIEATEAGYLGIVVPVAVQSTFPIVWDFIEQLPPGKGRKVFFADTMESFSGGIVGPMKKALTAKDYMCIAAHEFKMATSMQTTPKKVDEGERKNAKALEEADDFVQAIVTEKAVWRRVPIFSDAMRAISKGRGIWTKTSERIQAETALCVQCGLCQKHCPVNAITMTADSVKIQHEKCIACVRCVNYCPQNAFTLGGKHVMQKKVIAIQSL